MGTAIDVPARPWNPRFLAYAKAHGFEGNPEGMLAHDRAKHPCARAMGFLLWIDKRLDEWRAANKVGRFVSLSSADQASFEQSLWEVGAA